MHVSYNMHVIDCNMPVTCLTFHIGWTIGRLTGGGHPNEFMGDHPPCENTTQKLLPSVLGDSCENHKCS